MYIDTEEMNGAGGFQIRPPRCVQLYLKKEVNWQSNKTLIVQYIYIYIYKLYRLRIYYIYMKICAFQLSNFLSGSSYFWVHVYIHTHYIYIYIYIYIHIHTHTHTHIYKI